MSKSKPAPADFLTKSEKFCYKLHLSSTKCAFEWPQSFHNTASAANSKLINVEAANKEEGTQI